MSFKIPCGGFRLDEKSFSLDENGVLSIPKPLTYDYMPEGYPSKSVETTSIEVDITWDGNTSGLVASSYNNYYRVSNTVYTLEQFKKMNYVSSGSDVSVSSMIEQGGLNENNGLFTLWAGDSAPVIVNEEAVAIGSSVPGGAPDTFTEPGVYFPAGGSVTRLYSPEPIVEIVTTIEKLSEEFLPYEAMKANNPVGEGSFSMNRRENSEIGAYSFAEGYRTTASGEWSHAEGGNTTASGERSHAEGANTTASGEASHAEGTHTTASGETSHAEGNGTIASGETSHAEGRMTVASSMNQHVQGRYNIEDSTNKYAHIVGNGTDDATRSNAHTIDWSGNAWFAGAVEGTAVIVKSSTAGSPKRFKITVDDSGTIKATEVT